MKRIASILTVAAVAAAMLAGCCPCRRTVKIVLVPERIILPAETALNRGASEHPDSRPFKYANPRTHRDSLLLGLEQASREAAYRTNEKYGLIENR